jgi:hypothetical protein
MADGPVYKGTKQIAQTLSYKGLDEQLRKLEGFDPIYLEEMSAGMASAVRIAEAQAKTNAPSLTGALKETIYGKMLTPIKGQTMAVRGAIGSTGGLKGFAQEVGRFYGNAGAGTTHYWKGKFYLYYGAQDKADQIMAEYQQANQRIVNRLVVK